MKSGCWIRITSNWRKARKSWRKLSISYSTRGGDAGNSWMPLRTSLGWSTSTLTRNKKKWKSFNKRSPFSKTSKPRFKEHWALWRCRNKRFKAKKLPNWSRNNDLFTLSHDLREFVTTFVIKYHTLIWLLGSSLFYYYSSFSFDKLGLSTLWYLKTLTKTILVTCKTAKQAKA